MTSLQGESVGMCRIRQHPEVDGKIEQGRDTAREEEAAAEPVS